jgi:hypothetical protein
MIPAKEPLVHRFQDFRKCIIEVSGGSWQVSLQVQRQAVIQCTFQHPEVLVPLLRALRDADVLMDLLCIGRVEHDLVQK